jgi:hypothetical protein
VSQFGSQPLARFASPSKERVAKLAEELIFPRLFESRASARPIVAKRAQYARRHRETVACGPSTEHGAQR